MNIIIAALALSLLVCIGIIYDQHQTIIRQRKHLLETLEWIEPDDLVRGDCNGNCSGCMNAEVDP